MIADTIDKGYKAYTGGKYGKSLSACAAIETFDAGIWQLTASVALPGFTIHQIVALTILLEEVRAREEPRPFQPPHVV